MATPTAQRRPGREPRRHERIPDGAGVVADRSTKAGARTPATPGDGWSGCVSRWTAQRRPGREPRRHATVRRWAPSYSTCAQRRPGREPRRHHVFGDRTHRHVVRSTKAGARTPATLVVSGQLIPTVIAQRRPGREPRRHSHSIAHGHSCISRAQRRPGREPRRHRVGAQATGRLPSLNEGRGANPGDTDGRARQPAGAAALNEGRGANPGDTRSAARDMDMWRPWTLNEGRGANPGDTARAEDRVVQAGARSTKAGARTPATHRHPPAAAVIVATRSTKAGARTPATRAHRRADDTTTARSTKAGARTPATPRELRVALLVHHRSTKAGARTPATPYASHRSDSASAIAQRRPGREPRRHAGVVRQAPSALRPLNEGRGANPGDTMNFRAGWTRPSALNEGRGANPGDTLPRARAAVTDDGALNEGRGANPGDTFMAPPGLMTSTRAQRRPGREPRRHARRVAAPMPTSPLAQRRPGREPRRHSAVSRDHEYMKLRSTKAGARTPATPAGRSGSGTASRALNEGRGANPGDTVRGLPGPPA